MQAMYFFGFLFAFTTLFGSSSFDFSSFDTHQDKWTRQELEIRMGRFLQKDGHLAHFFTLTDDALTLYDAPQTQRDRQVEYTLRLTPQKKESQTAQKKRENLVGVKIAIDPGHLGGRYARMEQRFIEIPPSLDRLQSIQFDEGTLCLQTALYLKLLLEKEGAIVMLTRDQIGKGVYEEGFFDWLKNKPNLWSENATLAGIFRKHYCPLDLRARAEKINAFDPDLSIILHYNAHHVEEEYSSNNCVSAQNYNLVFMPGAFCRNELAMQESRFEFLRLLLSDDLEQSHALSREILSQLNAKLHVPSVTKADGARYLQTVCMRVEEGVYARNLALTRLVRGPVCYGETLIQNNIAECLNLSRKDFVIGGKPCSSRVKQVAEAYFEGIKRFLCTKGDRKKAL